MHDDFWRVSAHQRNPQGLCHTRPLWGDVEQTEDAWEQSWGCLGLCTRGKERRVHRAINSRELLIQRKKAPKARLHYVRQRSQQPIQKSSHDCIMEGTESWAFSTMPAILIGEHSTRVVRKSNYGDQQPGKPQVVGKLASVAPQLSSKDDSHSK